MHVKWACLSDVGVQRSINEDNYGAEPYQQLFVVADGMGGHAGGELASRLACESISKFVVETRQGTTAPLPFAPRPDLHPEGNRLSVAIQVANRSIYDTAVRNPAFAGMGCTLVSILAKDRDLMIAHVGDSRCYLLRADKLIPMTRDHSVVNELIAAGQLAPENAYNHPEKNIVTRALGVDANVEVEVHPHRLKSGDIFLLCSDGISDKASDRKLREFMDPLTGDQAHDGRWKLEDEIQRALRNMIDYSNQRGGDDNATAMIVYFEDH